VKKKQKKKKRNINTEGDMYSSRRSGPVTDLHNAHTVSTLMRTMTTTHHPHRPSSRSKTSLNGTLPFRSSSIHQVWKKRCWYFLLIKNCSLKVENRDRDIERLHRIHDTDRSSDLLKLEGKLKSNEKIISHQNAQVNKKIFFIYFD
jgi:hypothetical protein